MLDIGFSELILIVLVMLVVLSPKDIQRLSRTLGQWVGKSQQYLRDFKDQVQQTKNETGNEIGSSLKEPIQHLREFHSEVKQQISEVKNSIEKEQQSIEKTLSDIPSLRATSPLSSLAANEPPKIANLITHEQLEEARKIDPFADPYGLPPTYDELVTQVKSLHQRLRVLEEQILMSKKVNLEKINSEQDLEVELSVLATTKNKEDSHD